MGMGMGMGEYDYEGSWSGNEKGKKRIRNERVGLWMVNAWGWMLLVDRYLDGWFIFIRVQPETGDQKHQRGCILCYLLSIITYEHKDQCN